MARDLRTRIRYSGGYLRNEGANRLPPFQLDVTI